MSGRAERVCVVRRMLAEGVSVADIRNRLAETEGEVVADAIVRRAITDRWAKAYSAAEEAILVALCGWVSPGVLAGALGRKRKSIYLWKSNRRPGRRGEVRCAGCASKVEMFGFPEAEASSVDPLVGSLDWACRCLNCGKVVRFRLNWMEVV